MSIVHKHFESSYKFAEWLDANKESYNGGYYDTSKPETAISALKAGDNSHNALIESFMKNLEENIPVIQNQRVRAKAGFRPNVPAYIRNEPNNMYKYQHVETDTSPVSIWIGLWGSIGFTRQEIAKRGAAICAFAKVLSNYRSVHIYPILESSSYDYNYSKSSNDSAWITWDCSVNPLVQAEITACLVNHEVTQCTAHWACRVLNPRVNGAYSYQLQTYKSNSGEHQELNDILNIKPQDLVFPAPFLGDPLSKDPEAEVKRLLRLYLGEIDELTDDESKLGVGY